MPESVRSSVVLPAPFGPISATRSPEPIEKLRPSSACTLIRPPSARSRREARPSRRFFRLCAPRP